MDICNKIIKTSLLLLFIKLLLGITFITSNTKFITFTIFDINTITLNTLFYFIWNIYYNIIVLKKYFIPEIHILYLINNIINFNCIFLIGIVSNNIIYIIIEFTILTYQVLIYSCIKLLYSNLSDINLINMLLFLISAIPIVPSWMVIWGFSNILLIIIYIIFNFQIRFNSINNVISIILFIIVIILVYNNSSDNKLLINNIYNIIWYNNLILIDPFID